MKQIVTTMKVYVNGEAVPVYDIKIGIRRSVSSASSSRHILPLRKEPPALTAHDAGWASNVWWRQYPHALWPASEAEHPYLVLRS